MAEGAGDKGRDRHIGRAAAIDQHEIAAQRELGDVEFGMTQGAEEGFFHRQRKECRIAAFDRDPPIDEGAGAIVVPTGHGKRHFH
jgi:hypothetical protein